MNKHLLNPNKVYWGTHLPIKSAKGKTRHTDIYAYHGRIIRVKRIKQWLKEHGL